MGSLFFEEERASFGNGERDDLRDEGEK